MCPPTHFRVVYSINPWMDPGRPVDTARAVRQWKDLVRTYRRLGHSVELVRPLLGQPDMVFAANGAVVIGDVALGTRFRFPERAAEAAAFADHLRGRGRTVHVPAHPCEGEGDLAVLADVVLAGSGFRTAPEAHVEAAAVLDRPVVPLELVDPRFYHLDTALAVLDDGGGDAPRDIAYYPGAFAPHSRRTLRQLFPDALLCTVDEAASFALNAVSDGHHVVLPAGSTSFAQRLGRRGYVPVEVELDELLKAGGSVKCCTLELHA